MLLAYPDAEILGSGNVNTPFDIGVTADATGFVLLSDEEMAVSYAETLSLVDLGRYDLMTEQPPALDPGSLTSQAERRNLQEQPPASVRPSSPPFADRGHERSSTRVG